jgi:hypothetical protein
VANVQLLQLGLVLSVLAHAVALIHGKWRTWPRGVRVVADLIAVFVFARLPYQLHQHRPALAGAGLPGTAVEWLLTGAIVVGVVVAASVAAYWWLAWRRATAAPPSNPARGQRLAASGM